MKRLTVLLVISLMPVLLYCSREETTAPETTIKGVIESGGEFEDVVESHEVSETSVSADTVDGDIYCCTRKTHKLTTGFSSFPQFDPNAEIIYPGNLLQGASLANATPQDIVVDRGGGTIVMTIMSGAQDSTMLYYDVDEVCLSQITQAANDIIADVENNDLPARLSLKFSRVSSQQELGVAIGANFSNMSVEVSGEFNYQHKYSYNRMLVKLVQSYYTLVIEPPTSYSEVFAPGVTPEQLSKYIGPGNPAAYISSVTYGRIFYLLVQTTSSSTAMELNVEAFVKAAVGEGGGSVQVDNLDALESLDVSGYALGGRAEDACGALLGDLDDLEAYIEDGNKVTYGVPISYVVRSLSDPSRIVKVKINTEYDEINCVPVDMSLDNNIFRYKADYDANEIVSEGGTDYIDLLSDYFQDPTMTAAAVDYFAGALKHGAIMSSENEPMPAMRFYDEPGMVSGILQFNKTDAFIGSDYTIFALVKLEDKQIPYPAYIVFGSSPEPLKNLSIGFWDDSSLIMSHRGRELIAGIPPSYDTGEFNVLIFRFSRADGMSMYINHEREPIGHDAECDDALIACPKLYLGSNNGGPVQVVEIVAYGMAVSEAQRLAVYRWLAEKYIF